MEKYKLGKGIEALPNKAWNGRVGGALIFWMFVSTMEVTHLCKGVFQCL